MFSYFSDLIDYSKNFSFAKPLFVSLSALPWRFESDSDDDKNTGSPNGDTEVIVEEKTDEPSPYAVILHNDDYTTMDFVIEVLMKFFHKNKQEAVHLMLSVHHKGSAVAGIYSFEIAETKADQVMRHAKAHGFPLRCSIEPLNKREDV